MKLVLAFLMLVFASPSFADETFSTRLFSTKASSQDLPDDLSFRADRLHVVDASWFASLFGPSSCDLLLQETDIQLPVEIKSVGPRKMKVSVRGKSLTLFNEAQATYVPLFYQNSMPVHPHFMVKLKDWVILHVVIHRSGAKKHMKVSVVHIGRHGEGNSLHPVFEADGI